MPTALVVDDSKVDQRLAGNLLAQRADLAVRYADNGQQALESIAEDSPDVVLSDMQMPEMDGLELVEAIRKRFPKVPVIIMTAHGSEEIAAEALRKGASSYVPKRYLSRDLARIAQRVLAVAGVEQQQNRALECLVASETEFVLDNDPSRIQPLVRFLRQELERMNLCDETAMMRIGVALDEAISNAIQHGNLAVLSELRETDMTAYYQLVDKRRTTPPYSERRIHLLARINRDEATFVVRDEGEGFDPHTLPDPTDPANLDRPSGRGLFLIRNFMDEVRHNDVGNEITMIKRRDPR